MDAVGDKIDVIMDSGVQRGTHVLKALSLGAKAVEAGVFICMLWLPPDRRASRER